ncbi:hypothetical protein Ancab_002321 [Ancistrocladus abbreviatus]
MTPKSSISSLFVVLYLIASADPTAQTGSAGAPAGAAGAPKGAAGAPAGEAGAPAGAAGAPKGAAAAPAGAAGAPAGAAGAPKGAAAAPTGAAAAPTGAAGAPAGAAGAPKEAAAGPTGAAATNGSGADFDITKFGAKPGDADISSALLSAWKEACASTTPSKVVIPKGTFTMLSVKLLGPCKAPIRIEVAGTVLAPPDPAQYKDKDSLATIEGIDGLTIIGVDGGGIFDGQGATAWKKNECSKKGTCNSLPYNFRFNKLKNSRISKITSKDSKLFHIGVMGCTNVTLEDMTITAPGESVNTDGVHISRSEGINITGTKIGTGDDCISIGGKNKEINVQNVECGPGHGISVGSLGKTEEEGPVVGVYIKNCTFANTDNGVRIKTWLGSHEGSASEIHFEDVTVTNVTTPVVIDQAYCPFNHCPSKEPSKVKLSNISFKRIKGTAGSANAMKLVCSSGTPCENVEVADIDLTYGGKEGPIVSECANVQPKTSGKLNPAPCTKPAVPAAGGATKAS